MGDQDAVEQLKEIAALLRRRVELAERAQQFQEDRHRESEEKVRGLMEGFSLKMPSFEMPEIKLGAAHDEQMRRIEERSEEDRGERREFQERLLAEIERHNVLLERILSRVG